MVGCRWSRMGISLLLVALTLPGYNMSSHKQRQDAEANVQPDTEPSASVSAPCDPELNLCGPNSECQVSNGTAKCSCEAGFVGCPPSCHHECEHNADCRWNHGCVHHTCRDPCSAASDEDPEPCGPNSCCKALNGSAMCSCEKGFVGTPPDCHYECEQSADCDGDYTCIQNTCVDPCFSACASNAICEVENRTAVCSCPERFEGNPRVRCHEKSPCDPEVNPCGKHSVCKASKGGAMCSCEAGFVGSPPSCKHECKKNADCRWNHACVRHECVDPCSAKNDGDPAPCGPNSCCKPLKGVAMCSCEKEFVGTPPDCQYECQLDTECDWDYVCIQHTCVNPCLGACGVNAFCDNVNRTTVCSCPPRYEGDPLFRCVPKSPCDETLDPCGPNSKCHNSYGSAMCSCKTGYKGPPPNCKKFSPCSTGPCGPNSMCTDNNEAAMCSCNEDFDGEPPNCYRKCTDATNCSSSESCVGEKCVSLCDTGCASNAYCYVQDRKPVCTCPFGTRGDPEVSCDSTSSKKKG